MASYRDLLTDWATLEESSSDFWSCTDMQLAAELGKTLLDRNRELESTVREQQATIEDQAQEIEYLTKQTAALREVNDSRLGIYEHLEASITELERSNHRLVTDALADKKLIRNLSVGVETLEARCEELQRTVDQWEERARNGRLSLVDTATSPTLDVQISDALGKPVTSEDGEAGEMTQLLQQIQDLRAQRARDQRKIEKLEEETAALAQENLSLEEQLAVVKQQRDAKSRTLEEEVQMATDGNGLCVRCVAALYANDAAEGMEDDEDETNSMASGSIISQTDSQIRRACFSQSPYQTLMEKFEALLQVQRKQFLSQSGNRPQNMMNSQHDSQNQNDDQPLSLQEELQMSGDFSGPPSLMLPEEDDLDEDYEVDDIDQGLIVVGDIEEEKTVQANHRTNEEDTNRKLKETVNMPHPEVETLSATNAKLSRSRNGTANQDSIHFYETETASSGFSDDPVGCVHRSTQTDELIQSGPCHGTCHQNLSTKRTETSAKGSKTLEESSESIKNESEEMARRGTLLCSITEGEDVHVSIYDEALPPTKSRFIKNHPCADGEAGKDATNGVVGDKQVETTENRRRMFREICGLLKRTLMEARESAHMDDVVVDGSLKVAPADTASSATPLAEAKPVVAEEEKRNEDKTEEVKPKEVEEGEKVKFTPYRKASREDFEPRVGGSGRRRREGRRRGGTPVQTEPPKSEPKQPQEEAPSPVPSEVPECTVSADECQPSASVKRRHHKRAKNGGGKALLFAAVKGNHQRSQGEGGERCSWPMGPSAASSPSADMARLMRLERSYADALRLGAPRKEQTPVWGRGGGGGGYRGSK